jgi:hypothetical protein
MDMQFAEVFRKPVLLLRCYRLSAKEQNLVFDQQITEAIDIVLRQFIGQVDAVDNGAERWGNTGTRYGHVGRLLWRLLALWSAMIACGLISTRAVPYIKSVTCPRAAQAARVCVTHARHPANRAAASAHLP